MTSEFITLIDKLHKEYSRLHIDILNDSPPTKENVEALRCGLRMVKMMSQLRECFIGVPICYRHPDDEHGNVDETKKLYDIEEMTDDFERQLKLLDEDASRKIKRHIS